jgi:hypothetical protein
VESRFQDSVRNFAGRETISALSYLDVRYTDGRRRILPIEQTIHGFMDVLPLVAVAVLGVQHWQEIRTASLEFTSRQRIELDRALLLLSFAVLAGFPILEEMLRTARSRVHVGLATIR